MGAFAAGQVVLVHFPFSDLTASKLRPAVVLADAGRGEATGSSAKSPATPTAILARSLYRRPTLPVARCAAPALHGLANSLPLTQV
jgi:hypothetical protein